MTTPDQIKPDIYWNPRITSRKIDLRQLLVYYYIIFQTGEQYTYTNLTPRGQLIMFAMNQCRWYFRHRGKIKVSERPEWKKASRMTTATLSVAQARTHAYGKTSVPTTYVVGHIPHCRLGWYGYTYILLV